MIGAYNRYQLPTLKRLGIANYYMNIGDVLTKSRQYRIKYYNIITEFYIININILVFLPSICKW